MEARHSLSMGFTLQICAIYGYNSVTFLDCAFKASCTFGKDSMNLETKVQVTPLTHYPEILAQTIRKWSATTAAKEREVHIYRHYCKNCNISIIFSHAQN